MEGLLFWNFSGNGVSYLCPLTIFLFVHFSDLIVIIIGYGSFAQFVVFVI